MAKLAIKTHYFCLFLLKIAYLLVIIYINETNDYSRNNCFVIIVYFHNRFDKALTEIFQFCRALAKPIHLL